MGKLKDKIFGFFDKKIQNSEEYFAAHDELALRSEGLGRDVRVSIFLPPSHSIHRKEPYHLLLLNDGQDADAVHLGATLRKLYRKRRIAMTVVAAIHAGDRLQEYGTIGRPDYQGRGAKANAYALFITAQLLPYLREGYHAGHTPETTVVAGFSLGGLSAFDFAWHHPHLTGAVGVFSGSLWWRSKAFDPAAPDADRIVHTHVAESEPREGLRFWFQCGSEDEREDRNQNGIIDSIDDTLDLMHLLEKKGYRRGKNIEYVEVEAGQHDQATWAEVLPAFLEWGLRPG